jgi:hypothetical protein
MVNVDRAAGTPALRAGRARVAIGPDDVLAPDLDSEVRRPTSLPPLRWQRSALPGWPVRSHVAWLMPGGIGRSGRG